MQSDRPSTLERAFTLARTGAFRSKSEIAKALWREGYRLDDLAQLTGPTMTRQLRALCRESQGRSGAPTSSGLSS